MAARYDVLIVGAGHAGASAAMALRQRHFAGSIGLLGDEVELPYERPPLSKDYLSGQKPFERILLRPASFWADQHIALLPGRLVARVDAAAQEVETDDGKTIGYGALVWATGGSPRRLTCDGHHLAGVHSVRNRADVDRMIAELPDAHHVVVVGGGYIGLEAAAVLTKLGKPVTVLEALDRVLARVAGETLSRFFEGEHRRHGVDLRTGVTVSCITGDDRVTGVQLADGHHIACDMVIVGIGIVPAVQPLAEAGADVANGVRVDALCRTSLPDVYAIGDCAAHENAFADGAVIRLESVQNANDQAQVLARLLTGEEAPYHAIPWFWSNQYDLRLQTAGLCGGHDQVVTRGDPASRSFSVVYLKKGRVIALDCVNAVKDYVQGRALVTARVAVAADALADPTISLKELAAT